MSHSCRQVVPKVTRFLKCEDGPTSVEYAVMLALILMVAIGSISVLGGQGGTLWENNSDELAPVLNGN